MEHHHDAATTASLSLLLPLNDYCVAGLPLPMELAIAVFSFLERLSDVYAAMQVCSSWRAVLLDSYMWQQFEDRWFGRAGALAVSPQGSTNDGMAVRSTSAGAMARVRQHVLELDNVIANPDEYLATTSGLTLQQALCQNNTSCGIGLLPPLQLCRRIELSSTVEVAALAIWSAIAGHCGYLAHMIHVLGADTLRSISDSIGRTPLYHAAKHGHVPVIAMLLERGAGELERCRNTGASPLYIATQEGHYEAVRLLLSKGASPTTARCTGATPLFIACQTGRAALVQLLLHHKADPNAARLDGVTPVFIACEMGRYQCAELLLQAGASLDVACAGGYPINAACKEGNLALVQLLVRHGASVNACNPRTHLSNLHVTAKDHTHSLVMRFLLQQRAYPDVLSPGGTTPLVIASLSGNARGVQALLEFGADTAVRFLGRTPLELARLRQHHGVVTVLELHRERSLRLRHEQRRLEEEEQQRERERLLESAAYGSNEINA